MSFLSALLSGSHNQISTRQALLVVGLQNDFTSPQGKLPVNTATGYLERIKELVPAFREHGEIFWITTEYRGKRSVNHSSGSGCMVIADDGFVLPMVSSDDEMNEYPSRPSMRSNRRINQVVQRTMNRSAGLEADSASSSGVDQDLFLSQDNPEDNCCLPGSWGAELSPEVKDLVSPRDVKVVKSYYSAFTSSSLLLMLRAKLITEVYVVGCTTNLSVYATALDAAQHGLSINLVEDCLNYRLKHRHDRAVQKLVEIMGASVTTSASVLSRLRGETNTDESGNETGTGQSDVDMEDQPGTVREPSLPSGLERYLESLRLSDDQPHAADGTKHTSLEHAQPADSQLPNTTDHRREPNPRLVGSRRRNDDMHNNRTIQPRSRMMQDNNASAAPYGSSRKSRESLKLADRSCLHQKEELSETQVVLDSRSNIYSKNLLEVDLTPDESHTSRRVTIGTQIDELAAPTPPKRVSRKLQMRQKNSTLLSPDDKIGSGDSKILYDLLEPEAAEVAFQDLFTEVNWQRMYHAAGEVPRLVCCQGDIDETDGSMPVYRHPSDQSLPLLRWSPVVTKIKEKAEERVGHKLNHALIQLYRSGQDHISEHSDKTLDIVHGSKIVNVSLGAQRIMRLRTKRPTAMQDSASSPGKQKRFGDAALVADVQMRPEDDRSRVTQRIPMPHNSMFVMGLETNGSWLHGIMPDKRPAAEHVPAESAYGNMRISITFRLIGTFLSADSKLIWGQGAVVKNKSEARPTVNGNSEESQRLINAFGVENQVTAPEWDNIYGTGFDVLHLKTELSDHEKPMLFLSGEEATDAAVTARLSALDVDVEIIPSPTEQLTDDLTDANGDPLVVAPAHRRVICFRQAAGMHTEVQGKTAILKFLEDVKSRAWE
jgi:nicotinamidase-related amidase/alkylated DNA repair dioxygenase AlkB